MSIIHHQSTTSAAGGLLIVKLMTAGTDLGVTGYSRIGSIIIGSIAPDPNLIGSQLLGTIIHLPTNRFQLSIDDAVDENYFDGVDIVGTGWADSFETNDATFTPGAVSTWDWPRTGGFTPGQAYNVDIRGVG